MRILLFQPGHTENADGGIHYFNPPPAASGIVFRGGGYILYPILLI